MENQIDTELVALARNGDKQAFGQLVERYESMAKRVAVGMVANEDIARELVQEAILEAYLSLDHLRDNTRFKSWLYGIVLNVCRSYIREQKSNPYSLEALMGGMYLDRVSFSDGVLDPEVVVEERERYGAVLDAVQALSAKDRTAILLFYYEQLSIREVAAILEISVIAVKGRLHRARKQLKERLSAEYAEMKDAILPEHRRKMMVKSTVAAVLENSKNNNHAIILADETGRRVLNIWIGEPEAMVIAMGIAEVSAPRPMSAHLLMSLMKAAGMELEEVRVEALKDDVFYAVAKFRNGNEVYELDARPSDAISLAVHMDRPIYVAEEVMERAGITLPEGKTVQVMDRGKVREDVLKKLEEGRQASFLKRKEEVEQANQEFLALLMGKSD